MKKTLLAASLVTAFTMMSTTAQADYANVVIDSDVVLNYNQEIDMTGAVNVPTVEIGETGDNVVSQNNHDVTIQSTGIISDNNTIGGDINLNVNAIGNNASIEVDNYATIGSVQGNQESTISASGFITENRIGDVETELNVTAVGNNLSIARTEVDNEATSAAVGAIQFNYDTTITATGVVKGNNFGVQRDPVIKVSAIGNNFSAFNGVTTSNMQLNKGTTITSFGSFSGNVGNIGPVDVSVTSVGNNLSIKLPDEG